MSRHTIFHNAQDISFDRLISQVEFSRIVSSRMMWLYKGVYYGKPGVPSRNLLRCMKSSKYYQYRMHEVFSEDDGELRDIFERGNLLTVRNGIKVFTLPEQFPGAVRPNVDTFWMLDCLESFLTQEGRKESYSTSLEIGLGSGLTIKTLPFILPNLQIIHGVDIDPDAVACTTANVSELSDSKPSISLNDDAPSISLDITSPYTRDTINCSLYLEDARTFNRASYDLVLCNPPYIPLPPSDSSNTDGWCVGTDVILETLWPQLMNDEGRMLITVSEQMAGGLVETIISKYGLKVIYSSSVEVKFNLPEILGNAEYKDFLLSNGYIRQRGGRYFHTLRAYFLGKQTNEQLFGNRIY